MAKIKMVCDICGNEIKLYTYKTQHGKYICQTCYDTIAIEGCEKYGRKKI